jgi:hypothetical protein
VNIPPGHDALREEASGRCRVMRNGNMERSSTYVIDIEASAIGAGLIGDEKKTKSAEEYDLHHL